MNLLLTVHWLPDPTRVLLLPHIRVAPTADTLGRIAAALATQFSVSVAVAKAFLRNLQVEQWGKVHRVNSTEGDTMRASIMGSTRDDSHDVSHVCVCTLTHVIAHPLTSFAV